MNSDVTNQSRITSFQILSQIFFRCRSLIDKHFSVQKDQLVQEAQKVEAFTQRKIFEITYSYSLSLFLSLLFVEHQKMSLCLVGKYVYVIDLHSGLQDMIPPSTLCVKL